MQNEIDPGATVAPVGGTCVSCSVHWIPLVLELLFLLALYFASKPTWGRYTDVPLISVYGAAPQTRQYFSVLIAASGVYMLFRLSDAFDRLETIDAVDRNHWILALGSIAPFAMLVVAMFPLAPGWAQRIYNKRSPPLSMPTVLHSTSALVMFASAVTFMILVTYRTDAFAFVSDCTYTIRMIALISAVLATIVFVTSMVMMFVQRTVHRPWATAMGLSEHIMVAASITFYLSIIHDACTIPAEEPF